MVKMEKDCNLKKLGQLSHIKTRRAHVNDAKFMCTTKVRTWADCELGADWADPG